MESGIGKESKLLTDIDAIYHEFRDIDLYEYSHRRELERVRNEGETLNILGISTTVTEPVAPRRSTSEWALERVLEYARLHKTRNSRSLPQCNTVMLKMREIDARGLRFCEGYYSNTKSNCSWPCNITVVEDSRVEQNSSYKANDHMDLIYKALLWADVVFVSTPIRYGNASALYYKMIERLNSVHNEMTLRDHQVMREKVAGFIITGGQDGVQAVAGQMLTYWSELGFIFSRYSYVGWNRGWYAEDTAKNFPMMATSQEFDQDLHKLVDFALDLKIRLDACKTRLLDDYERKEPIQTVNTNYQKYDPGSSIDKDELEVKVKQVDQANKPGSAESFGP